jgi:hypothetical protein
MTAADNLKTITLPIIGAIIAVMALIIGLGSWAVLSINGRVGDGNASINSRVGDVNANILNVRGEIGQLTARLNTVGLTLSGLGPAVAPEGQLALSPLGGQFTLTFNPRVIKFEAPSGSVSDLTRIFLQPDCASKTDLGKPPGYQIADWSYGFTAFTDFTKILTLSVRYTQQDLQKTGAQRAEDLTVLQWVPSRSQWIPAPTRVSPQLQQLGGDITESGCLTLGAKIP